jgi:hypothetical protein
LILKLLLDEKTKNSRTENEKNAKPKNYFLLTICVVAMEKEKSREGLSQGGLSQEVYHLFINLMLFQPNTELPEVEDDAPKVVLQTEYVTATYEETRDNIDYI